MKKSGIKTILALLLTISLGSSVAFAGVSLPSDVVGDDCETAVQTLMDKGIITGDTDGLYHPEKTLSRAEISVMLGRAIDSSISEEQNVAVSAFSDMQGYGWASSAIALMAEKNIAKGYPDGTFKPGAEVTVAELVTFVMRACGYEDEMLDSAIWPDNYMNEAKKLGFYSDASGKNPQKEKATKEIAAIVIFNALDKIKTVDYENPADYVFAELQFEGSPSKLNGKELADDFKLYVYGKKNDYSKDMELPSISKLMTENVYKYKNVSTNGFYKVVNGKAVSAIIPTDVGFSGKIYGVITDAYAVTIKDEGNVLELMTLAGGMEMSWLSKKSINTTLAEPIKASIPKGQLYEMKSSKGRVTAINEIKNNVEGTYPAFIGGTHASEGLIVTEKNTDRKLIKLSGKDNELANPYIAYRDTTVVYVLNEEQDEYTAATMSAVRNNYYLRAYDVTDDDNDEADIIIVCREPFAE